MSREENLAKCKSVVAEQVRPGQSLVRYYRRADGRFVLADKEKGLYRREPGTPVGVIVHFRDKDSGTLRVGYSLCHKNDKFNKTIALLKAVNSAMPINTVNESDLPGKPAFKRLLKEQNDRAQRFFNKKKEVV